MRTLSLLAGLLLAACAPQDDAAPGGAEADPPIPIPTGSTPAPPSISLVGHWRVAGIDGAPLDGAYGIGLTGEENLLFWEPACAGQDLRYEIAGTRFWALPSLAPEPRVVCDIGYPEELDTLWEALKAADTIARTPENAVRISGGGRSVTLFSQ